MCSPVARLSLDFPVGRGIHGEKPKPPPVKIQKTINLSDINTLPSDTLQTSPEGGFTDFSDTWIQQRRAA
jgi:hypothetical protein